MRMRHDDKRFVASARPPVLIHHVKHDSALQDKWIKPFTYLSVVLQNQQHNKQRRRKSTLYTFIKLIVFIKYFSTFV